MKDRYRRLATRIARWRSLTATAATDDRGEINSSVAWAGAMVLLAVTLAGILAAKATGFTENINFGP